jgi:hypothetical protein
MGRTGLNLQGAALVTRFRAFSAAQLSDIDILSHNQVRRSRPYQARP